LSALPQRERKCPPGRTFEAAHRSPAREGARPDNILAADPLLTVADVAIYLSVDASFVYAHADELGAIRLGSGSRPRLRFRRSVLEDYLVRASCSVGRRSQEPDSPANRPIRRRQSSRPLGAKVELLPIRGRRVANMKPVSRFTAAVSIGVGVQS
jgi:hypothetical protein